MPRPPILSHRSNPRRARALIVVASVAATAIFLGEGCGSSSAGFDDGGAGSLVGSFGDDAASSNGGCTAPDMLIVLDHTLSMAATPSGMRVANTPAGHAQSKWGLATDAVKAVSKPPSDKGVRFGLELFPLDPQVVVDAGQGHGDCVTITDLLDGQKAMNAACQPGEVLLAPALDNGGAIDGLLDTETVRLCVTTPIAAALETAATTLKSTAGPSRNQFVLLVTDGGETCKGDSLAVVQQLAAAGVQTFVVGFGSVNGGSSGVNVPLLNDLACAGMTAKNLQTVCTKSTGGYVAANANGPLLFYSAQDGASLSSALQSIAGSVCCPCAQ